MGLGTSMGAYYDDEFHKEAARWDPKYDTNEVSPDVLQDSKQFAPTVTEASMKRTSQPSSVMPFPDNHNPDMDFNNRFTDVNTNTSNLTPEDLSRLALANRGVDDRRSEGSLSGQFSAQMQALKQWGHDTIHPDAPAPIPDETPLSKALGSSNVKAGDEKDRFFSFMDPVVNDVLHSSKLTGKLWDAFSEWKNPTQNITKADQAMDFTPQERDLYQRHLDNLNSKNGVDNPNGSRSTLFVNTFQVDDKHYVIPSVWNGKIESPEKSMENARFSGLDKFPSYNSKDEAEARYTQMHSWMEKDTAEYLANRQAP